MRTTLNLDDFLINKLLELTNKKSKTKAITIAIEHYIKETGIKNIVTYQGNLNIEDNWQRLEDEELKEYKS